ncbi:MAG: hypothetical protein QG594_525 [Bacteroidota bacterium]|nr:hypothetical protein [Bacteroidota bacterium]
MAKKIEVDIAYLKSIGLSQKQISDIVKNSEPDHWTNKLPEGNDCYELLPFMISPEFRLAGSVNVYCATQDDPALSFFKEKDAEFIQNKCRLLIEMSNFSFAVNESWSPDWNDKEEKKYGIVLQNGQARVSENELFNLYVFGIVTRNRSLALEMLEEFKERVEIYFNKPFNSVADIVSVRPVLFSSSGSTAMTEDVSYKSFNTDTTEIGFPRFNEPEPNFTLECPIEGDGFIDSFLPKYENATSRKKKKFLINGDIEKIQEMLLKNVQQKDIAEKFNYSEGTISRVKKQLGFNMAKRNKTN